MKMSRILALIGLSLALLGGCAKAPAPAQPSARQAVASASESRTLCLADPTGQSEIDAGLRSAQSGATKFPAQAGRWVAIGREWVRKARLSADPGFYLNVDGCAKEALTLEPDALAALELRSLVLMNDHLFEQARALAQQIVQCNPESVLGYGTLSDALLELGRYDESARAAQQQMQVRPGMAASARGSYLRWLKGDSRGAKLLIRDALIGRDAADPEPAAWVLAEAATLYWHEGDADGADALYAEALKWLPNQRAALLGRARIALARGNAAAAIEALQTLQHVRPSVEAAWLLGDAQELKGDGEAANLAYAEAVRLGRRGDRMNLALFYASKNRDIDEALRLIEAERSGRAGVYVDDIQAWALYRAGRLDAAFAASRRALAHGTRDARLLYHAGAIQIARGDTEGGRRLVAEALQLNPGFDLGGAREARALMANAAQKLASR